MTITATIIKQAVQILRDGGLVAFPTETVYGLGADAQNAVAIAKIFQAKQRPHSHPLIVHLADTTQLSAWAAAIPPIAWQLTEAFWPGPLTLILKKQPQVLDLLTGGQSTIGLRVPRHPIAQALLQAFGSGVAAPSANQFTHLSPTDAAAVQAELGAKVDLILDGGACAIGLESTIVDVSGAAPRILRPGMLSAEAIAAVVGQPVPIVRQADVSVPGQHPLHYAPQTHAQLLSAQDIRLILAALPVAHLPIAILTYSLALPTTSQVHVFTMPAEPHAYAHALYQTLRAIDYLGVERIMIEEVPEKTEWAALHDRLTKATAHSRGSK